MLRPHNFYTLLTALLLSAIPALGQERGASIRNSPTYERAAEPLRSAPDQEYDFHNSNLSDIFRLMAQHAGISYISLPSEGEEEAEQFVTFKITASPFEALERVAQAHGVAITYEQGLWYLRPANDTELIGRSYIINHNTKEKIVSASSGGSGGSGGGSSDTASTGIDISGDSQAFEVEPSLLVEEVKEILGISSSSFSGSILSSEAYESLRDNPLLGSSVPIVPNSNMAEGGEDNGAKVIWNADTNSLFVVATHQQHQWVGEFLAEADKTQPLIAIEMKFIETSRDPREQLGFDWTSTLGEGLNLGLSDIETTADFNYLNNLAAPATAILSSGDLNVRLRALLQDSQTEQVSYPRVLTLNNREVVIRSVVNQPVLAATSSTTPGAGATTTQQVTYLPIGTEINVLPRQMSQNTVMLNVKMTISTIIGEKIIAGNPYPVASSRIYSSPLQVTSGYTVAIGGLDEALNTNGRASIPILSQIPILGELFKSRDKTHTRKNLMLFITPTLIHSKSAGISERPVSLITSDQQQQRLQSRGAGDPLIEQFDKDLIVLEQLAKEGRGDREDYNRADYIHSQSEAMIAATRADRKNRAGDPYWLDRKLAALQSIHHRSASVRKSLWFVRR